MSLVFQKMVSFGAFSILLTYFSAHCVEMEWKSWAVLGGMLSLIQATSRNSQRNEPFIVALRLGIIYGVCWLLELSGFAPLNRLTFLPTEGIRLLLPPVSILVLHFPNLSIQRALGDGDLSFASVLVHLRNYLLAPIAEELLFKQILALNQGSILLTSLQFSVSHFYRLELSEIPMTFAYTFLFGVYSCILYSVAGCGVFCCCVVHCLCNLYGIPTVDTVMKQGGRPKVVDSIRFSLRICLFVVINVLACV